MHFDRKDDSVHGEFGDPAARIRDHGDDRCSWRHIACLSPLLEASHTLLGPARQPSDAHRIAEQLCIIAYQVLQMLLLKEEQQVKDAEASADWIESVEELRSLR